MPFLFRYHEFYDFLLETLSWCDKESGKVLAFKIHWFDDSLEFWRGHRNAFTNYVDRHFWVWDN